MAEEFPQDDPRGFAVKRGGSISLRTASYREEAAMINALVLFGGVDPYGTHDATDEQIRSAFAGLIDFGKASSPPVEYELVRVVCTEAE